MPAHVWLGRLWLSAAAAVTLGILGFYAHRLLMPLPIFAPDEGAYLIRAIYTDLKVANYPLVQPVTNGVHLSVIRAVHSLGADIVVGDRLVNAAAYLGGLLLVWRMSVRGLERRLQVTLLLVALGVAYYRFAFSNMAEGLFVGILALFCLVTGRWYRSRPLAQAVAGGALAAMLVLAKPNGIAVVAALALLAGVDALLRKDWRLLTLRVALFAGVFFVVGNLIQVLADEPLRHPLSFFVGDLYRPALALKPPPSAPALGSLALGTMIAGAAVLMGMPMVAGAADMGDRWRRHRADFELTPSDVVFAVLVLALGATLVMVAIYTAKVSADPTQTKLLWGRYFEFYAPLIWLAAAPALAKPLGPGARTACAAVVLAGLAGLMAGFAAGVVIFPWDDSVLSAFFARDPIRAPLDYSDAARAIAIAATLLAAGAVFLRVRPADAGLGLLLTLGVLSTRLDHIWLGPLIAQRAAFAQDMQAIKPLLPPTGEIVLLAPDANDGHLGFLELKARPRVLLGPPAQTLAYQVDGGEAVVVSGPDTPPGGPWTRTYKGQAASLFLRTDTP